jgi:16S rRNA (cytidine1402-2'-O)-methyltransferase
MNKLYVVSTPIGNLEDITIRAIKVLLNTRVIACEDTRRTGMLIRLIKDRYESLINITPTDPPLNLRGGREGKLKPKYFLSIRDWNEASQVDKVLDILKDEDVALVSDAGTPLLSDPGFKVVREAGNRGFEIIPIPGPFAAATALSVAGLPTNKFMFWGFLPKKWEFEPEITHIIYESPLRLNQTIKLIEDKYPNCEIVIANELTKVHERIRKHKFGDWEEVKGEVTVLVNYGRS